MAMDRCFEEAVLPGNFDRDGAFSARNRESVSVSEEDGDFDCNICLDAVREPVVTLCGHLFCWPCIHKWLHLQSISSSGENQTHNKQCPVCKSEVSHATLVPLYGRGRSTSEGESKSSMPGRPTGPVCKIEMPSSPHSRGNMRSPQRAHVSSHHGTGTGMYYSQRDGYYPASPILNSSSLSHSRVLDPVVVMFGEMVSTRLLGTRVTDTFTYPDAYNLVGSTSSPRMRRHMMQTEKSLSRICLFLVLCVVLCLLLF